MRRSLAVPAQALLALAFTAALLVPGLPGPPGGAPVAEAGFGALGLVDGIKGAACKMAALDCKSPAKVPCDVVADRKTAKKACSVLAALSSRSDGFVASVVGPLGPGRDVAPSSGDLDLRLAAQHRLADGTFGSYHGPLTVLVLADCPAIAILDRSVECPVGLPVLHTEVLLPDKSGVYRMTVPAATVRLGVPEVESGVPLGALRILVAGLNGGVSSFSPTANLLIEQGNAHLADRLEAFGLLPRPMWLTPAPATSSSSAFPLQPTPSGIVPAGGDGNVLLWGTDKAHTVPQILEATAKGRSPASLFYLGDGSLLVEGRLLSGASYQPVIGGSVTVRITVDCSLFPHEQLCTEGRFATKTVEMCRPGDRIRTPCAPGRFEARFKPSELSPLHIEDGTGMLGLDLMPVVLTAQHSSWAQPAGFNHASQALLGGLDEAGVADLAEDSARTMLLLPNPPAVDTPPGAVPGLQAEGVSPNAIRLTWQAASDDVGVDHYRVELDTGSGIEFVATVDGLSYEHGGLRPNTEVDYLVSAVDTAAQTGPASAVTGRTQPLAGGGGNGNPDPPRPTGAPPSNPPGKPPAVPPVTPPAGPGSGAGSGNGDGTGNGGNGAGPAPTGPSQSSVDPAALDRYIRSVGVEVTRDGEANLIQWTLPADPPLPVGGVQVWRSNSPYVLLEDYPAGTQEFQRGFTWDDSSSAKMTSRYLVTVYFEGADGVTVGRLDAANAPSTTEYRGTGVQMPPPGASSVAAPMELSRKAVFAMALVAANVLFLATVVLAGRKPGA